MAGKLYYHNLHAQTDAQIRNFAHPGIGRSLYHSLDSPVAKTSGNYYPLHLFQPVVVAPHQFSRVNPVYLDFPVMK